MFMDKQQVLYGARNALNRPDQPWYVAVEGDAIVARWNWMDAVFFAPHEVNDETRNYTFRAVLNDKGKWREVDHTEEKSANVTMEGGKLKIGGSGNSFVGKTTQKSIAFGHGVDKQTGQAGLIGFKFDTSPVKQSIRAYLTNCGWKKAGLFG